MLRQAGLNRMIQMTAVIVVLGTFATRATAHGEVLNPNAQSHSAAHDTRSSAGGPATGACCVAEACIETTQADCETLGGTYEGDDVACGPGCCLAPTVCGDDVCQVPEQCQSCPQDCGPCPDVELLVQDATSDDNPPGTKSCQVLVHFNDSPGPLLAVTDADISTTDPSGFFQVPPAMTGGDIAPSCSFIPLFPVLAADSFVTIGLECASGANGTNTDPDFDSSLFNTGGAVAGGWFNTNPANGQGDPDVDGNVLAAQFTVGEDHSVCGTVTVAVATDNTAVLNCPDFNGDNMVNAVDLAQLLGLWGPAASCSADLNGDGAVNEADLTILLSYLGQPCPDEPQEFTIPAPITLSFACPGSSCDACGDGTCDRDETCETCPQDCGFCPPPVVDIVVQDASGPDNPPGTRTCDVLLHFDSPDATLLGISNADISTNLPSGFFQHGAGFDTAPACPLIPPLPELAHDSFVTIGLDCDPGGDGTVLDPSFDSALFNTGGAVAGGWFNAPPNNGQGVPDANEDVLIARFTAPETQKICGTLTAWVEYPGGPPADCGDLNGDEVVNGLDLLMMLGDWGDCAMCPSDLNGDGTVNDQDLFLLLVSWGPCPDEPRSVTSYTFDFQCPGPACFGPEITPAIPKWTQLPDLTVAGTSVESNTDWSTIDEIVADAFISDGRPITNVRWWGSYLDPDFSPGGDNSVDGWLLSFHSATEANSAPPNDPDELLGVYVCPPEQVLVELEANVGGTDVYRYEVELADCCLEGPPQTDPRDFCPECACDLDNNGVCDLSDVIISACNCNPGPPGDPICVVPPCAAVGNVDCDGIPNDPDDNCATFCCLLDFPSDLAECGCLAGTNPISPAQPESFNEQAGFVYYLGVQSQEDIPTCATANNEADGPFWAWRTSNADLGCLDFPRLGTVDLLAGVWDIPLPDMSAFQDQAFVVQTQTRTCPWDLTGGPFGTPDGQVNAADLALLLGNWQSAPPYDLCIELRFKVMDFNADFRVDAGDLARLLGNWGPCPCFEDSQCPSNDCQNLECEPIPG